MAITFTSSDGVCRAGSSVRFSGYADDFANGVAAIEFSLDGGANWTSYPTTGAITERGVNWSFSYTPEAAGTYVLLARATDNAGHPSPLVCSYTFTVLPPADPGTVETFGSFCLRAVDGGPLHGTKLFRSRALTQITAQEAQALASGLGIRAIYDLRDNSETATAPLPYLVGMQQMSVVPSVQRRRKDADKRLVAGVIERYGAPGERMRENYRRYVDEYPTISATLRSIAADHAPALVCCANGKDRTGVLSAILEKLAGRHEDSIMENYLRANELNAQEIAAEDERLSAGMTEREREILRSFLEARPEYLQAFFSEVDARYGTFDAYVRDALHLDDPQRESLVQLMEREG